MKHDYVPIEHNQPTFTQIFFQVLCLLSTKARKKIMGVVFIISMTSKRKYLCIILSCSSMAFVEH